MNEGQCPIWTADEKVGVIMSKCPIQLPNKEFLARTGGPYYEHYVCPDRVFEVL